jgi:ribose transport system substrate-binding protein
VFIGADNYEIGRQAGEHIVSLLGGKGKIVELRGLPGSPPAIDRGRGMHDVVSKYPGIQIVHDPVANWLREEAMTQMEMALAANPVIDLVYAHNDPMAVGAYLAAKAKGREKSMKFIGIDALPGLDGGRQAVADGKLDATFVYPTGGREAVELAAKILKGEKVSHRVVLPTQKITRSE